MSVVLTISSIVGFSAAVQANSTDGVANDTALFLISLNQTASVGLLQQPDGTTTVPAGNTGVFEWIILPQAEAAPDVTASLYAVSGSFSYTLLNVTYSVALPSVQITVYAVPELQLHYFLPAVVPGDDPFTTTVVEPSLPWPISVVISNIGRGQLLDLTLHSTQPVVLSSEKQLLIALRLQSVLLGGVVQLDVSTVLDVGAVSSNSTVEYRLLFTSSLQGDFQTYNLSSSESLASGARSFTKLDSIDQHTLVQLVVLEPITELDDPPQLAFLCVGAIEPQAGQYDLPVPDTLWQTQTGEIVASSVAAMANASDCVWSTNTLAGTANLTVPDPGQASAAPFLYWRCPPPSFFTATGEPLPVDAYHVPIGWSLLAAYTAGVNGSTRELAAVDMSTGAPACLWMTHRGVYPLTGAPIDQTYIHLFDMASALVSASSRNFTIVYAVPSIASPSASSSSSSQSPLSSSTTAMPSLSSVGPTSSTYQSTAGIGASRSSTGPLTAASTRSALSFSSSSLIQPNAFVYPNVTWLLSLVAVVNSSSVVTSAWLQLFAEDVATLS